MFTKLPNKQRLFGLFFFSMLVMSSGLVRAQGANTYSFTQTSGTYTPISGTATTATGDDGINNTLPIGFSFNYGGTVYTTFNVTTNGFIKFGAAILTGIPNYTNTIGATNNVPMIAAFWDDNNATGGSVQYLTAGLPGSQTLTVQWSNVHIGGGGSTTTPTMSFQIILYEANHQIDFVYGGAPAPLATATGAIGLTTASGNYLSVTPGAPATASTTVANDNISSAADLPAGTVYTFSPPPPCSGQPPFGQTTASVVNACANVPFTLGVSGVTSQIGLTYEFFSSPAGLNTFTSLGAAQASPNFTIANQTAPTDYYVVVTCTGSSLFANATQVSVGQNLFYNCYCTPVSNCVNEGIENVTFSTINNTSAFCVNPGGYTDYSNLGSLATVVGAQVVSMSVTAHINSSPASAGVWIDYNHSGTFEASEYTSLGSVSVTIPTGGTTNTFTSNVTIDANALTGLTRMRVRSANQAGITNTSSCITTGGFGEFEDYLITINAGNICTGTPTAGNVTGPSAVCPNVSFTLNAANFTTGFSGFTYLWEVFNTATSTWDPAAGTNNTPTYTATTGITAPSSYRFTITCTNGNNSNTTAAFPISVNPYINCYCIPTGGTSTNYGINNFSTTGGFTNISNLNTGTSPNGYTDYSATMTLTTAASSVIGISGSGVNAGFTYGWAVWVDWDHSGTFDASEKMFNTTGYTNAIAPGTTFTVPVTALQGNTKMRVIANYLNSNPSAEQCSATSNAAEWEDYMVNIGAPPTCLPPTSLGTSSLLSTSTNLTWVENNSATLWQIEHAPAATAFGSGTRLFTGTNPHGISGLTQNTAYKFYVRSVCSPGDTSAWTGPFNFTTTISCPAPTALTFANITGTSVDVSWTGPASSYILEYGPTGYVPGTGATGGVGGTLITNAVSPVNISGLSPNSGYDIFVRQDCSVSSNGYSSNLSRPLATTGAPGNDDICNATMLTLNAPPSWVNTTNATVSATDPTTGVTSCTGLNNNVWYQFTTNGAGVYNITGYASSVMTTAANQNMSAWAWLYTVAGVCPTFTLTQIADLTACNANLALPATNNVPTNAVRTIPTPALAASTTYYLFLDGNSGSLGNIGISVNSPLGVKLEKITAVNVGSTNRVEWNTLGEERSDRFELERSADGKTFTAIHERSANGVPSQYTYIDNSPLNGDNYYRLRMRDASGNVNYSETVKAFVKSTGFAVEAYPNPVSKGLTVRVSGLQGSDAMVQVTDLTGKVITSVVMDSAVATINMNGLANGIYLVRYSDANRVQTIKVTKQ